MRSVLLLLLYLAYFTLLLEASDDNENSRSSNRACRKKKCAIVIKGHVRISRNQYFTSAILDKLHQGALLRISSSRFSINFLISPDPSHCWSQKRPYNNLQRAQKAAARLVAMQDISPKLEIRMTKSVDTFKQLLKTHLVGKAFYSQVYVSDLSRFFIDVLFTKAFYSQLCFYTDVILIYHLAIFFYALL